MMRAEMAGNSEGLEEYSNQSIIIRKRGEGGCD
jgi:hypothetical protein